MKAILVVSHGSRIPETVAEVKMLVSKIKAHTGEKLVEYAFLEIAEPSIPVGIEKCVEQGATEVQILLNFLNAGRHVDTDIPQIVAEAQNNFPHVKITLSKPVGQHEKIVELFADLIDS